MRVASLKTGGKAGHQSVIEAAGHHSRAARSASGLSAAPAFVDRSARGAQLAAMVQMMQRSAQVAELGSLVQMMQSSPQVTAQLARNAHLAAGASGVTQRVEGDEEDLLQGKFAPIQRAEIEDEEPLQGKFAPAQRAAAESAPAASPNRTGLPDGLKSGIESLSGISLDQVRVHYNSSQPAQLSAHAYAQGSEIHLAPGQEQHLPHETWHVVQQAQGRVKPTMQMKDGVPVNDDAGLEREADKMGGKAAQMGHHAATRTGMDDAIVLALKASDNVAQLIEEEDLEGFPPNPLAGWPLEPDPLEGFPPNPLANQASGQAPKEKARKLLNAVFRRAFAAAGLPYYNPHSFRDMLVRFGQSLNLTVEELKAWSQNLGHADVLTTLTTLTSYGSVPVHRQGELIRAAGIPRASGVDPDAVILARALLAKLA